MSSRATGSTAVSRVSTGWLVPTSVLAVSLILLLVAPRVGESGRAAATVGFVLAEALVLYVGYGALGRVTGPAAREFLAGP